MPQHDYVIENQLFPATRADINSVLAAVAQLNSGASAPSTAFPYMLWADTANSVLKQRSADNTTWHVRGTLSEALVLAKTSSSSIVLKDRDALVTADCGSGDITLTLPAASQADDAHRVWIKRLDASANTLTIDTTGADTIDGQASLSVVGQYSSVALMSNGDDAWHVCTGDPHALRASATANLSAGFTTDSETLDAASVTATVIPDLAKEQIKTLVVDGNFTLQRPAATGKGMCVIKATVDATGGRTMATTNITVVSGSFDTAADAVNWIFVLHMGTGENARVWIWQES